MKIKKFVDYKNNFSLYENIRNEEKLNRIKSNLSKGIEPTKDEQDYLDDISNYTFFYTSVKTLVESIFNYFKNYNYKTIKNQLLQHSTKLPKSTLIFKFSLSYNTENKGYSLFINHEKLNDRSYILDIVYNLISEFFSEKIEAEEFLSNCKPALWVKISALEGTKFSNEKAYRLSIEIFKNLKILYKDIYDHKDIFLLMVNHVNRLSGSFGYTKDFDFKLYFAFDF